MSKELDKLIDISIEYHKAEFSKDGNEEFQNEVKSSYKDKVRDTVYSQVRNEIYDSVYREAIESAEKDIEKTRIRNKISDYKKLCIEGIVLALFIGMLVNQLTDIISFFKGNTSMTDLTSTCIISLVFLGICIFIVIALFISEIIKLLGKGKE